MKSLSFIALAIAAMCSFGQTVNADYSPGSSMSASMDIQWQTNFDNAVAQAKAQNKPLLVLFTGSDWCSWCIKLENEVFSSPDFAQRMSDKFVYVKLDYPMSSKLPPDQTKQNRDIKARYKIDGFPTVLILSPNLDKIGSTGYRAGGPQKYAQMLQDMVGSSN